MIVCVDKFLVLSCVAEVQKRSRKLITAKQEYFSYWMNFISGWERGRKSIHGRKRGRAGVVTGGKDVAGLRLRVSREEAKAQKE